MIRIFTFIWLLILFLAAAFIARVDAATRYDVKRMVMEEAQNSTVPVSLALAVAKVESDFNAKALSSKGARGVMQIMPQTAREEFGVSERELWDPRVNIRLGVRFLARLYNQYEGRWDLALSHYNGGTVKGDSPHQRTRKYVASVQKWQGIYQEQASLWADVGQPVEMANLEEVPAVPIRPWQVRGEENDFVWESGAADEGWGNPREEVEVVIVRRRPVYRSWHRPPPPPRPFGHHRGGPGPHFH